MKKVKIGSLTVGQTPRVDITGDLPEMLREQMELIEFGALDRYSREEVHSLSQPEGDYLLTSRMRDGEEVHVCRSHILPELQSGIRMLEEMGVKAILVFCTGELGELQSSVSLLEPNVLLREAVPCNTNQRHVAILCPSRGQVVQSEKRWKQRLPEFSFTVFPVSPYQPMSELKQVAERIERMEDVELVLMDCLGYSLQMQKRLEENCNKKILLPREILFQAAAEIIEKEKEEGVYEFG